MIRILVDSASDYPKAELQAKGIEKIALNVAFGEEPYFEDEHSSYDDFYEMIEKTKIFPKTSQPSPQSFLDIFEDAKKHQDEVICILLSSALSGTYQSAILAKDMAEYDGIYVIDSLTATCMIKILADHACQLRDQGKTASEIVTATETLKSRVKVVAVLDTLEYLYRGGRLGKTSATIGELAKIKPVITVTEDGLVGILSKCLGKMKAMNFLLKHLEKMEIDPAFPMYSVYTYGEDNMIKFEQKLLEKGYHTDHRLQIGSTIGTHVGPGVFGVIYVVKA